MQRNDDPRTFRRVTMTCHDRLCQPCGASRGATLQRNLAKYIDDSPHRFLTLTLKHSATPLRDQLTRLNKCFRRLRNTVLWKERVTGGAAFLELTRNAETATWHVHLHVIIAGKYIPVGDLSQRWLAVTGDSQHIDLRLIRHKARVVEYCVKYATKPIHPSVVNDHDALVESIQALVGRKLVIQFGNWSRWRLTARPDDEDWHWYDLASVVQYAADHGDEHAAAILEAFDAATDEPFSGEVTIPEQTPP
jgi:hypothetical protein